MAFQECALSQYGSVEELREDVIRRHPTLSKRLQQVGEYLIDYENDFAIETVAMIAERSGVQPSAVVRFAKEFGFNGASSLQRLLRERLISGRERAPYRERIRNVKTKESAGAHFDIDTFFEEYIEASVNSLQALGTDKTAEKITNFASEIAKANIVYITGVRRAFPVSTYFEYALGNAGKRSILVDTVGALHNVQVQNCRNDDLILATSFQPHAPETIAVCERAKQNGARIALLTDSEISPVARLADTILIVRDAKLFGFRSLSSTLSVAQAIVVTYIADTENEKK